MPNKLRILALHGGYQNGTVFNLKRTKDLQKKLKDIAEFVCVDGPILATRSNELIDERRSWFNWDENDPELFEAYIHMDEITWWKFEDTCKYLNDIWISKGPFDGVLGFSQGAEAASVWIDDRIRSGVFDSLPKFFIAISAFLRPKPLNFPNYASKLIEIPSLHIFGLADQYIPPSRSLELAEIYVNSRIYQHQGTHVVPQKSEDCEEIRSFLKQFV